MIKQVIFDLGRVLFEWEPKLLAQELAQEDESFQHEVWKITTHPTWLEFDLGNLNTPDLIKIHSEQFPAKTLELFMERVPHILKPIPEGLRLVEAAKERGLKKYILSNMSHDFYHHLMKTYSFLHDFDGSIYSCHLNLAKPDPEIYQAILKEYQLKPEECLFVDDIPENIEGAKAMGIQALVFTKSENTYREFLKLIET